MTAQEAWKIKKVLITINYTVSLAILLSSIYIIVKVFLENSPQKESRPLPDVEKFSTKKEPKLTEKTLRPCWQTTILENVPPPSPKTKLFTTVPIISKRPKLPPITRFYAWVGVMVHSSPGKSFAIVLDKQKNRQILVEEGKKIPNTSYQILQIQTNEIKISTGESITLLINPKALKKSKFKEGTKKYTITDKSTWQ